MKDLYVKIVCPDGQIFAGVAKSILVTTEDGEVQLLAGHADFLAVLGTGRAKLALLDGSEKLAAVSGGFVTASSEGVTVVATTFEFAEDIDIERAKRAKAAAEERMGNAKDARELDIARAKLARAITRISIAS